MRSGKKRVVLTVDAVIERKDGSILLIKRKYPPFRGAYALPGGSVEYGESTQEAVVREAREETGLKVRVKKLVGVFSDPKRDPRGHYVSVAYMCKEIGGRLRADSDAKEVVAFKKLPRGRYAFDHRQILKMAGY